MAKNATFEAQCLELTELVTYSNGSDGGGGYDQGSSSVAGAIVPGVIICFLSSLLQALGMTLQKYAHSKQQALARTCPAQAWPVYKMWVWHVGLIIYLVSQLGGQPLALTFLPPSIVAPLGSITLGFNALFAWLLLGERLTIHVLLGTLIAAGGSVLVAYYGYAPQGSFDVAELIMLFGSTSMIAYMCFFVGYIVLAYALGRYLDWCTKHGDQRPSWLALKSPSDLKAWKSIIHATISGALGASVLLLGKAAVEIAITTFTLGDNQFADVGTYFILVSLAIVGVSQMVFLNSALSAGEASIVVPVFFCFFAVLSMVETMVYFDQWACFSATSSALIMVGIAIILFGVWLLSQNVPHSKPAEDSDCEQTPLLSPPANSISDSVPIMPQRLGITSPEQDVPDGGSVNSGKGEMLS